MAVKRAPKDEKPKAVIPADLQVLLTKAFSFQGLRDQYGEVYDEARAEVKEYLEHTTEMTVDLGKGFRCDEGMVTLKGLTKWKFDNDKIIELVKSGKVSIETIVSMASFSSDKLKAALGETAFNSVASSTTSESLAMNASPDFKAEIAEKFKQLVPKEEEKVKVEVKAPEPVKFEADSKSKAKAAAAKAKGKSKVTPVEDDLDAILRS